MPVRMGRNPESGLFHAVGAGLPDGPAGRAKLLPTAANQSQKRRRFPTKRFPRGWCSAQRIINPMIAGGNHTTIPSCQKSGPKGPFF